MFYLYNMNCGLLIYDLFNILGYVWHQNSNSKDRKKVIFFGSNIACSNICLSEVAQLCSNNDGQIVIDIEKCVAGIKKL